MANALYTRLQATAKRQIEISGQSGRGRRRSRNGIHCQARADDVRAALCRRHHDPRRERHIYSSSVGIAIVPQVGDIVSAGGMDDHIVVADADNYDGVTSAIFIVHKI